MVSAPGCGTVCALVMLGGRTSGPPHMGERLRLVARLLEGETMAVLCREFEISRKLCVGLGA